MVFSDILIGFAISYFAGSLPTVKALLDSRKSLGNRIEKCYNAALKQVFGIDEWHMLTVPYRYKSLQSFGNYLATCDSYDEDTRKLLEKFEAELKNDHECYQYIIEMKIDALSADINDIKQAVQKKAKSFSEVSTALKSVNRTFIADRHIDRPQTEQLYKWVQSDLSKLKPSCRIAALLGDPGTGKTVILADLVDKLERDGIPVIGLKADLLFDSTVTDIDKAVNIGSKTLLGALGESADKGLTVLVIDQMDALSLSLTTQRKPLAEVRRVIYEASKHPKMRVIFSCRIYDWENDLQLTEYDGAYIERLLRLQPSEVQQVLEAENIDYNALSDKTKQMLLTPVNLYLFMRVCGNADAKEPTTIAELQKLFWEKTLLTEAHRQGYETAELIDLLDSLSDFMVHSQTLVVPIGNIPTERHQSMHFLASNGFLSIDSSRNRVQFAHQTLFDYTYARLFCERHSSLVDEIKDVHQGIFLRNMVRRVLEYQRQMVEDSYIQNIKAILGIDGGKASVRFHLKQLVLTILGSQATILPSEADVLKKYVFPDDVLMRTFARTLYAQGSVGVLLDYIAGHGGFGKCDLVVSDRIIRLLPNFIFWRDFDFARRIVGQYKTDYENLSDQTKNSVLGSIRGMALSDNTINDDEVARFVLDAVTLFDTEPGLLPYAFVYRSLVRYYPQEVAQRLRKYVQARLAAWDRNTSHNLLVNQEMDYVIEALKDKAPQVLWQEGLGILDDLLQGSAYEKEVADIKTASLFVIYNRTNSYHSFPESFLDAMLDVVERAVNEKWDGLSDVLKAQSQRGFVVNHVVAIVGWLKDVPSYVNDISEYLINNINKVYHSSSLTYYHVELFGKVFSLCSDEVRKQLVEQVMQFFPEWEDEALGRKGVSQVPETYHGHTQARFLNCVDENLLRATSREAWTALQEAKRKFSSLDNEEPNKISMLSGWRTFKQEELDQMTTENLVEVAKKYDSDFYYDFDTPTRTGNAMAMREMVADNPDKMYEAYRKMIGEANLSYVTMGLNALLEAGTSDSDMEALYAALFAEIGSDVNSDQVSPSVLIDICRVLSFYVKNNKQVSQLLMDFVLKVAVDYHDEDDSGLTDIDQNNGINQVRGCAVHELVDCLYMDQYRASIISAFYTVATNASVATRCALLFKLGILANYDADALQSLFLQLTADYNENLLRLPAHIQNPLHYLVQERFDVVIPYFEHCVEVKSSHRVNVVWLWVATVWGKAGAKELLFQMADASLEGRSALVQYISRDFRESSLDVEIEALKRYIGEDNENLGSTYDSLFMGLRQSTAKKMQTFFDDFFLSSVCKYCRHYVYDFLKMYGRYDADNTLLWLSLLYEAKKTGAIEYEEITDVLLLAYNHILTVGRDSKSLEGAMNLLDDMLQLENNYMVSQLNHKLNYE